MNKKRNSGITLIALVITIIVLLILAGVSLSLVAGENGILKRATNAVDKNNQAQINEEVELAMADLKTAYYEDFYDKGTTTDSWVDYAKKHLGTGVATNNGNLTLEGTQVTYTDSKGKPATGTFDSQTGKVTITNMNPEPKKTINFTLKVKANIDGSSSEKSFSFTAYENEAWGHWLTRMSKSELDSIKEIKNMAGDRFSEAFREYNDDATNELFETQSYVYSWSIRQAGNVCRANDRIESEEYVFLAETMS